MKDRVQISYDAFTELHQALPVEFCIAERDGLPNLVVYAGYPPQKIVIEPGVPDEEEE